ncbi:MAG: hypothetical protein OES57_17375 [Acidimicrobiia bacterium]|nr:hypothetical protein [Acidimicrobiia bacterium]
MSRCRSQIDDSMKARDEAVFGAHQAGASLGAIGEAAGLEIAVVEQIISEHSSAVASDPS